jgi:cell division protease FtsH
VRRIIDAAIDRVRHLLETRRASLEALSKRLMEREVIDGEEMRQVVEETSPGPWIVPGTNKSRTPRPAADAAAPAVTEPRTAEGE